MTNEMVYLCYEGHCLDPDDCAITVAVDVIDSTTFDLVVTLAPAQVFVTNSFTIPSTESGRSDVLLAALTPHFQGIDAQGRSTSVRFCASNGGNPVAVMLRSSASTVTIVEWDDNMELNHEAVPNFLVYLGDALPNYPAYESGIATWYAKARVSVRLLCQGQPPQSPHAIVKKAGPTFTMYPRNPSDPATLASLITAGAMTYDQSYFSRNVVESVAVDVSEV